MREPVSPAQAALVIIAIALYFCAAALYFVWLIFRPKGEDEENDA